uniref:leucyl aminopeptidase n=1 Tax=Marinobacterium profundum TaxID=1714300 RepID=UPI000835D5D4|nr:leucyl aminopeptidase [Marinobacterium profundum]
MPTYLDMELTKAAYKLIHDQIKLKKGESVLITTDSISNFRVAEELAKMADALGGKVMLAWHSTPKGYGEVTIPYLPEPLIACADKTDVWIELNNQWLLYSSFWNKAVTNGRTRQVMLGGLSVEQIVRCIGMVDIDVQAEFQSRVVEMTKAASHVRITNKAGTDVEFNNDPNRPMNSEILHDKPGANFLLGQIGWAPIEESINGIIAIDGAISGGGDAELGVLDETISYHVEKGRIKDITGGKKAKIIRDWFAGLDDPNMYIAAHVCYGFNPNARLEGTTTEDERVWGSTEWGFGYQGPNFSGGAPREAKSHIDGICLDCTVYLDGRVIMEDGNVVAPELVELAKQLGH